MVQTITRFESLVNEKCCLFNGLGAPIEFIGSRQTWGARRGVRRVPPTLAFNVFAADVAVHGHSIAVLVQTGRILQQICPPRCQAPYSTPFQKA